MSFSRLVAISMFAALSGVHAQTAKPRARDLGIPIGGTAGPLDAITDVAGVEVGHTTLISGEGRLTIGKGPVRTGVTVIHPRGKTGNDAVFSAWFTLNGNGEMTGTTWIEESGFLEGPIAITNTSSVGEVRDAILRWQVGKPGLQPWGLPVVAETYDGGLNDINGFHVRPEHVMAALDAARGGVVPAEGNVGGGTGMICHGFKGGIGTSSRRFQLLGATYTVGVLVQCNYGSRADLRVAGVPVGEEIADLQSCIATRDTSMSNTARGRRRMCSELGGDSDPREAEREMGSIIVVVATDAPVLPHQLKRLATRVSLGIGRMGGVGGNSSGDIFVAFSTANPRAALADSVTRVQIIPNDAINALFYATIQATEQSILNALLAADTMTGANYFRVYAMPHDRFLGAMRKYGRLKP
jgi:D-aminopeptidase